jgi:S1-C subfamily serine protease
LTYLAIKTQPQTNTSISTDTQTSIATEQQFSECRCYQNFVNALRSPATKSVYINSAQCCTYAVPSDTISRIVPILIEAGEYIHPSIGLIPVTLNSDPTARESTPENIQGVIVDTIKAEGPASWIKRK